MFTAARLLRWRETPLGGSSYGVRFELRGDVAGQRIWQEVLAAVEELFQENERLVGMRRF